MHYDKDFGSSAASRASTTSTALRHLEGRPREGARCLLQKGELQHCDAWCCAAAHVSCCVLPVHVDRLRAVHVLTYSASEGIMLLEKVLATVLPRASS